jgi:predicted RND superfamily exporter protein
VAHNFTQAHPIIADIEDFDKQSGSIVERILFNNRICIFVVFTIVTLFLGYQATHLTYNANFEGTLPTHDPFMVNYLSHLGQLQSKGNALRIAVKSDQGTIGNAKYLSTLANVTDDVLNLPGIDRPFTTSLWTPNTRWVGVNQYGVTGGTVIDSQYDGGPEQVAMVIQNILRTGRVGDLVGTDFKSSMIYAPLMSHNGITGGPIDYGELGSDLQQLRAKYAQQGVTLYITGFAMVMGEMILGIKKILAFFVVSMLITGAMLYWFTRSLRCTLLVVSCTIVAVIWQLGLFPMLGYDLDPYSVLVPFLIFAIGMSHGAQKMNGVMQDIGRGTHKQVAARYTFRRLFMAGFTALICDAVGFAVLGLIQIEEIHELAIIASCGVAILIFTNLILLPILLSFIGVSNSAAIRSLRSETVSPDNEPGLRRFLVRFTTRKVAIPTVLVAVALGAGGFAVGRNVQVGNVGAGAPELRQNSQYNQDNRYIQGHYNVSSDILTVLVDSKPYACTNFPELSALDRLGWRLDQLPEVQSSSSMANLVELMTQTMTDNSPKWNQLVDNQALINDFSTTMPLGYDSIDCSFVPVNVSLRNLRPKTLENVISVIQDFINDPKNKSPDFTFGLAGGNGAIAAATDRVIERANANMLIWIYSAVGILCLIAFRSWLAVVCAILPLLLTSFLCQALMALLNIGVTVATLPVVALGVGIGVDYALYVLGVMLMHLRSGMSVQEAYSRSLKFTGRVVMLTGFTLAVGVGTWIFAPIKFQADMGLLLAFMFLWNMLGALIVLPALAGLLLRPSVRNDQDGQKSTGGVAPRKSVMVGHGDAQIVDGLLHFVKQ